MLAAGTVSQTLLKSKSLRYLIVEDSSTMREWLKATVRNQGPSCSTETATTYFDALQKLRTKTFDIVICDYILSDTRDGQQLLEECRHGKIIRSSVVWIMVTAERSYPQVIAAAELAPDDYIIKPLRPDILEFRLNQNLSKKMALKPLLDLTDEAQWELCATKASEWLNNATCRYRLDVMRLQAEALFNLHRYHDAAEVYLAILHGKSNLAWAMLGLAKTRYFLEHFDDAEELLDRIVKEHPDFLQGHDWLARVHQVKGRIEEAATLLSAAIEKNPKAINRVREAIITMRKQHDGQKTTALYDLLIKHGGGGSLIDASDICHHARQLAAEKNIQEIERLKGNTRSWYGHDSAFSHAVEATAMYDALARGRKKEAQAHYEKMQAALGDHPNLSIEDKLAAMEAALAVDDKSTALLLAQEIVSGDQASDDLHMMVRNALVTAGHHDDAKALEQEVAQMISARNYNAVKLAKEGNMKLAIEEFIALADKTTQLHVIVNAALAIAKHGHQEQLDTRLIGKLNQYLEYAHNNAGENPKVEQLIRYAKPFLTKPEKRFKGLFDKEQHIAA